MKSVGVKILKNNLSRYLKMVHEEGERIFITDRDEIIAELHRPITPLVPQLSRWETFLNEQEMSGTLIRAKRKTSSVLEDLKKDPQWPCNLDALALEEETGSDRF